MIFSFLTVFSILAGRASSNDVFYLGDYHAKPLINYEYIEVKITRSNEAAPGEISGEVYQGDTIEVTCFSSEYDKIQDQELYIKIGNATKKLIQSSSYVGGKTVTKYSVVATGDDGGEYTCVFSPNKRPRMKKQFVNVVRTQRPSESHVHLNNRTLDLGSPVEYLECQVEEGVPIPTYVWRKNRTTVGTNSRVLAIKNVELNDEGQYWCTVTNRAGSEYYSVDVMVAKNPMKVFDENNPNYIFIILILITVLFLILIGFCMYRRLTGRYLKIKNDEETASRMKYPPNIRIKFENMTILEKLGDGNFGVVEAGILEVNQNCPPLNVAVKSPRTAGDILQTSMINEEYEIMKGIRLHPNVLTLIGGVYDMEKNSQISKIVFELCELGSLSDYLKMQKYNLQKTGYNDKVEKCIEQLSFAYQVGSGMEYISKIPCVHRDLAARNVLLKSNKICRIADFGLTRLHENKDYYRARYDSDMPIRWMSIESITESRYTQKSDVWSFGIVLFEIFSLGEKPYPNIDSENIQKYILDGNINDKPQDCHPIIYELMKKCWRKNPKKRPEFTECVKFFEKCFMSNFPDMFAELQSLIQSEADKQQNMDYLLDN